MSLTLNLTRRHLKRKDLERVTLKLRQHSWSLERIAKALRVGTSTVHRWLEDVSQAEHVTIPRSSRTSQGASHRHTRSAD